MTDYKNTIIYKIQHIEKDDLLYVGHTTQITKRKWNHITRSKTSERLLYKMIRENGGWDMFIMKPIMEFPCENRTQALIQEEKCRLDLKATMNSSRCIYKEGSISQEKMPIKERNKGQINQENHDYYLRHKDERKAYRESISEKQKIYKKEWYKTNKDEINQKRYEKYTCCCGCDITKTNKSQHEKSKKHKDFVASR